MFMVLCGKNCKKMRQLLMSSEGRNGSVAVCLCMYMHSILLFKPPLSPFLPPFFPSLFPSSLLPSLLPSLSSPSSLLSLPSSFFLVSHLFSSLLHPCPLSLRVKGLLDFFIKSQRNRESLLHSWIALRRPGKNLTAANERRNFDLRKSSVWKVKLRLATPIPC